MLIFLYQLMLPGLIGRNIDTGTADFNYRVNVRLEGIADHQHLFRPDSQPFTKLRIDLRHLLIHHVHHVKKMPQSGTVNLVVLVQKFTLGEQGHFILSGVLYH